MSRTTSILVGQVIEVDDTIPVQPFIDAANELVTEVCTGTKGPSPVYSDTRLQMIETWLAAHMYAVRDPRATSESAGPVSASYESMVGLGLKLTRYGQQAMILDTNGGLAFLSSSMEKGGARKVEFAWLGKRCPGEAHQCP